MPEKQVTRLKDISVSIGRTGKATPIAELEEVLVGGSKISKATLHNEEQVRQKDLRPGDLVVVSKAGDVIPEVLERVRPDGKYAELALDSGWEVLPEQDRSLDWQFPVLCPCPLKTRLEKDPEDVARYCAATDCPEVKWRSLFHFVSKDAMNIKALSEEWVRQFIDHGLLNDVSDFYYLNFEGPNGVREIKIKKEISPDKEDSEDLFGFFDKPPKLQIRRLDKKQREALRQELEDSKQMPLSKLLFGLNIKHLGEAGAENVARHFGTLDLLMAAGKDEIEMIDGVGEVMSQSLREFFDDQDNRAVIERLREARVNFIETSIAVGGGVEGIDKAGETPSPILANMIIVVTGSLNRPVAIEEQAGATDAVATDPSDLPTLEKLTREEVSRLIHSRGGKMDSGVTKATDLLVVGDSHRSQESVKLNKAKKLGTAQMEGEDFVRLLLMNSDEACAVLAEVLAEAQVKKSNQPRSPEDPNQLTLS